MTEHDWYVWHHDYDVPGTALARRLAAVQEQVRVALDEARPGPLRAISVCDWFAAAAWIGCGCPTRPRAGVPPCTASPATPDLALLGCVCPWPQLAGPVCP